MEGRAVGAHPIGDSMAYLESVCANTPVRHGDRRIAVLRTYHNSKDCDGRISAIRDTVHW